MHKDETWNQLFESKMRRTSGTIICCLGVILGVTIVEGNFDFDPDWKADSLEDYTDEFYEPTRFARQTSINPSIPPSTLLADLQSILTRIAQSPVNPTPGQEQVSSGGSSNPARINLGFGTDGSSRVSGLSQSYSEGSSSASGFGSELSQSYSEGSSSASEYASGFSSGPQNPVVSNNGNQPASSASSSLSNLLNLLRQKVDQVKNNINGLSGQSSSNPQGNSISNEPAQYSTAGLPLYRTRPSQNSPSNSQGQSSSSSSSTSSASSSTNVLRSYRNSLIKQVAQLLSNLSSSSSISKSDIIKIIQQTFNDLKRDPSANSSVLNFEIELLNNLIYKLTIESLINTLNNIIQNVQNTATGSSNTSSGSQRPNVSSGLSGISRPSNPSSSDSQIRKFQQISDIIKNLVNKLQKVIKNNSSTSNSSNQSSATDTSNNEDQTSGSTAPQLTALQDISEALSDLVKKVKEGVNDLLTTSNASSQPSGNATPSSGNQAPQSEQDNVNSIIRQIQVAAKNLEDAVNSKLNVGNNYGTSTGPDDDSSTQTSSKNSNSSDGNVLENLTAAVQELLDGVNAIVANLLKIVANSGNSISSASPSDNSWKILKIRKLLTSILNDLSNTLAASQNGTPASAQNGLQASNDQSSISDLTADTTTGKITITETESTGVDSAGNTYTSIQGNYNIVPSSGESDTGNYVVTRVLTTENADGSVTVVKSGDIVQPQDNDESLSSNLSSSTRNNGQGTTDASNDNQSQGSSLSDDDVIVKTSSTSESASSSDSSSSSSSNGDSTRTSSSSSSRSRASSSSSVSSTVDSTSAEIISKLIEVLNSLLASSGSSNNSQSSSRSSSTASSSSANSNPNNSGIPSSVIAKLQDLLKTLSSLNESLTSSSSSGSSSSASSASNGNSNSSNTNSLNNIIAELIKLLNSLTSSSSQNTNSSASNSAPQTTDGTLIDSSSESQAYSLLTQLNVAPSSSSSKTISNPSLYPGLDNFQINSGHDTRVIITPGCSNPTATSASGSTSGSNSASSTSSSSSSPTSYPSTSSSSTSSSSSSSSGGSGNRYHGYDLNTDTSDYTLLSDSEGGLSGASSMDSADIVSGQYSNSDSSSGYGSVTLPRTNVISALGTANLLPGDQVHVDTKNGMLIGHINDLDGPITFLPNHSQILLNDPKATGRIWRVSSSNFEDDDCYVIDQCGCIDN